MRVLHLIDAGYPNRAGPDPDHATAACRELLARAGGQQTVAVLGPRAAAHSAGRWGLHVDVAIAPTLGFPEAGWAALRRWVDAAGRPDVVHAWGRRSARLALRTMGDSVPVVALVEDGGPAPADILLTYSAAARESLIANGAPDVRVIPPPVLDSGSHTASRGALRAMLGAYDDEVLIAQLGAPPQADAVRFAFLIGLLNKASVRVGGLAAARSAQQRRMRRFGRGLETLRFHVADRPLDALLPACDLAVFDGGGPGPTALWPACPWAGTAPIAMAHAAGIPVVAPGWAETDGLYPAAAREVCLAHNSTLPELARKLLPLVTDTDLRRRVAAAVSIAPSHGFVPAVREAWEDALRDGREGARGGGDA